MQVTVLGAGSWGTTVASVVAHHQQVVLWSRSADVAREINEQHTNASYLPEVTLERSLRATADLGQAVATADVLVVGIPSHAFREVLKEAVAYVRPWVPVVSLTKGIERDSRLRMTQVVEALMPGHPAAALTGPNLAKEIMAGYAAASVVATTDVALGRALQDVLRRGLFRVYVNDDVAGCELGGALKNVIAIAAGMAEGLSTGDNTKSAVVTRGLAELTRLGVALGGRPETFAGLAGLGDLMATCYSQQSRNRYVGEELGRGRKIDDILAGMTNVAEGVKTAPVVVSLAAQKGIDLPICRAVYEVLAGEITAVDAYNGLLRTRPGLESEPG
jgi:glycerol-3-phosphate dehydrogenase (NAD(P)+)